MRKFKQSYALVLVRTTTMQQKWFFPKNKLSIVYMVIQKN